MRQSILLLLAAKCRQLCLTLCKVLAAVSLYCVYFLIFFNLTLVFLDADMLNLQCVAMLTIWKTLLASLLCLLYETRLSVYKAVYTIFFGLEVAPNYKSHQSKNVSYICRTGL